LFVIEDTLLILGECYGL